LDLRIINRLRALSEGEQQDVFREMVSEFLGEAAAKTETLRELAQKRSFPDLAKSAHALKGLCLNFGAMAMARECDDLQRWAGSEEPDKIQSGLARLAVELESAREALSRHAGLSPAA
jgi:HPt (histidine-containing phosphotransfer) domain-containing protein